MSRGVSRMPERAISLTVVATWYFGRHRTAYPASHLRVVCCLYSVCLLSVKQLIIDAPRQRKQTRRFGNDEAMDVSDFEDLGSDSDSKGQSAAKVAANRSKAWTRHECFRVEKNLQTFG